MSTEILGYLEKLEERWKSDHDAAMAAADIIEGLCYTIAGEKIIMEMFRQLSEMRNPQLLYEAVEESAVKTLERWLPIAENALDFARRHNAFDYEGHGATEKQLIEAMKRARAFIRFASLEVSEEDRKAIAENAHESVEQLRDILQL